jgi:phosphocarrier protein HPr
MLKQGAIVGYRTGLHARPAKLFMTEAQKFVSNISVQYKDRIADGKSIISLLQLGACQGEEVWICADGADEEMAVKVLSDLLQRLDESN